MNDQRDLVFITIVFLLGMMVWVHPLLAQDSATVNTAVAGQDQNKDKTDQLINRIRIITKENDRLKKVVETYEGQLSSLEEENKKTAQTIQQLQDQLSQKSGESSGSSSVSTSGVDIKRLTKELADTHYNLGVIYQEQEKYSDAEMEYKKVLEVNPDDADAHYNLAIIYDTVRDNKVEALYYYKKYLELNPRASDKAHVNELIDGLLVP